MDGRAVPLNEAGGVQTTYTINSRISQVKAKRDLKTPQRQTIFNSIPSNPPRTKIHFLKGFGVARAGKTNARSLHVCKVPRCFTLSVFSRPGPAAALLRPTKAKRKPSK